MSLSLPPPDGNVSRGAALLACIWTPFPFALVLLVTRIYVRVKINAMGIDDSLMIAVRFTSINS